MHSFSFCPNPACLYHEAAPKGRWFLRLGFYHTKCFGNVPRYRCKSCGHSFSSQTFSLDYFAKKILDYRQIERLVSSSMSQRALSRHFKVSLGTINNPKFRTDLSMFIHFWGIPPQTRRRLSPAPWLVQNRALYTCLGI